MLKPDVASDVDGGEAPQSMSWSVDYVRFSEPTDQVLGVRHSGGRQLH